MHVLAAATAALRDRRPAALVTVIDKLGSTPRRSGSRMLVYAGGDFVGTIGGGAFEYAVIERAQAVLQRGEPERYSVHLTKELGMCCGGRMEVFIEPLLPRPSVVIYGAGHTAVALAAILATTDCELLVVDERDEWLNSERFPQAERLVMDPRLALDDARVLHAEHHIVLTHDHGLDQDLVEVLLPRNPATVGLIGSKAKRARFRARLLAAGMSEEVFDRLISPVGLDLGGQTPGEIAISIAAELVQRWQRTPEPT